MRILSVICLIGGSFISVFAQQPKPAPQKTPTNAETFRRMQERNQKTDQSFEDLKNLNATNPASTSQMVIVSKPAVSKLSKEQSARLVPESADSAKFETFLKSPNTGLIKIFPDLGCESKYVISVQEICRDLIPRSGFYSFRKGDYSDQELSDIRLKDNFFISDGLLSNGIMVALGDVPLETISAGSDGMKFLSDYTPATETKEASAKFKALEKGLKDSGYTYKCSAPVVENTTYAIRVIAYRGQVLKQLYANQVYNIFDGDKRVDIIAVFRVVRKNKDGSLTLLWKELERKAAPKIKISKEDKERTVSDRYKYAG